RSFFQAEDGIRDFHVTGVHTCDLPIYQEKVPQNISKTSGVDANSVAQIIKMAAPILMGVLGSQKRKDNVGESGIGDLLGSVLGRSEGRRVGKDLRCRGSLCAQTKETGW